MKCFFEYVRDRLVCDDMRPAYVCRAFGVLYAILMLLLAGVLYRISPVVGGVITGVLIGLVIFFRYIPGRRNQSKT